MQRLIKRLVRWFGLCFLAGVLLLVGLNMWMVLRSRSRVATVVEAVPATPLALVLGTSKTLVSGRINVHWRGRMDAAAALWKAGRVKHILVSGDNRRMDYNEPRDMRDGLVERGVPVSAIHLDYAGLRTLDSVIRAQEIFGVTRCVIVTDDFHLPRALWLADRRGMEVTGFHGPGLPWELSGKSRTREWLARINAAMEEWVLGTEATHYGEREIIPGLYPP
jgi:SanA protein